MSEQPKPTGEVCGFSGDTIPTGEWTVEMVKSFCFYDDGVVSEDGIRNLNDAIKASIAAERTVANENAATCAKLALENHALSKQLAAAQAANKVKTVALNHLIDALHHGGFNIRQQDLDARTISDNTALHVVIEEAVRNARNEWISTSNYGAILIENQQLSAALKEIVEIGQEESGGVRTRSERVAEDALTNAQSYPLPDGRTK